jgi:hypothetical protein
VSASRGLVVLAALITACMPDYEGDSLTGRRRGQGGGVEIAQEATLPIAAADAAPSPPPKSDDAGAKRPKKPKPKPDAGVSDDAEMDAGAMEAEPDAE